MSTHLWFCLDSSEPPISTTITDHQTSELMFARCEAIAIFISAFSRRKIAPKCLVHVRSGIAFGGNFSEDPRELKRTLLANKGGLPAFMLYDRMGSSCDYGDYLDLVEKYELVERWGYPDGGHLTLARLVRNDGRAGKSSTHLAGLKGRAKFGRSGGPWGEMDPGRFGL